VPDVILGEDFLHKIQLPAAPDLLVYLPHDALVVDGQTFSRTLRR
jgi:hypothetical protein